MNLWHCLSKVEEVLPRWPGGPLAEEDRDLLLVLLPLDRVEAHPGSASCSPAVEDGGHPALVSELESRQLLECIVDRSGLDMQEELLEMV